METSKNGLVLVVGAGPVGLASALELARFGQPVRIIETKSEPSTHSKAIGINVRTLELLEPSGVTERLLELGLKIPRSNFQTEDRLLFQIEFSKLQHRYNFMLGLPQSETERTIEKRLNEYGVEVERGSTLERLEQNDHRVKCGLSTSGGDSKIEAAYVIGADGAHSVVRKLLGIEFPGKKMPGDWSLADVYMESPLDSEAANVQLQQDGMLFMLRFKEGLFRVASNRPNVLERLPPGSKVHEVVWQSDFAVSHRQAETYNVGRVFLAGDAAHLHSPLGGRGMNLGIEDATILARRIVNGGLERYSAERHRAGASAIRMVRIQTHLATSTSPAVRFLRNNVVPVILGIEAVQQRLVSRMVGLGYS